MILLKTLFHTRRSAGAAALLAAFVVSIGAACSDRVPTEPTFLPASVTAFAREAGVAVCHLGDAGAYRLQIVNRHAIAGHRSHGDALPGEQVPGMQGYKFDANCSPVRVVFTNLTGQWTGTYSWNCGGTLTGSTPIAFSLNDPGTGRITGTASYLGGSSSLAPYESYRILQPVLRADGTWYGGQMDANGMYVRLTTSTDASFTYNQFDGQIGADFNSISGRTSNGERCGVGTGYAGSFNVTRVN